MNNKMFAVHNSYTTIKCNSHVMRPVKIHYSENDISSGWSTQRHDLQNRHLYLNAFNMMSISNQESIQFTIVVRIEMLSYWFIWEGIQIKQIKQK